MSALTSVLELSTDLTIRPELSTDLTGLVTLGVTGREGLGGALQSITDGLREG